MTPAGPPRSSGGWCLFCGDLVRRWRQYRGLDIGEVAATMQVDEADVRSWEAGMAAPSSADLSQLVAVLRVQVSVQDRLIAHRDGNHAHERAAADPPMLERLRAVVEGRSESPTIVTDQAWTVMAANAAAGELLGHVGEELQTSHANLLRLLLDPDGLRELLVKPDAWHALALDCVRRELLLTEEGDLATLHAALRRIPPGAELDDAAKPCLQDPCVGSDELLSLDVDIDGHRRRYDVLIETLTAFDADYYRLITLHPSAGT